MSFIADAPLCGVAKPSAPQLLYQLPKSGDWITLAEVTGVDAHHERDGLPADVVVTLVTGRCREINCESFAEAREIRDQIALARNAL